MDNTVQTLSRQGLSCQSHASYQTGINHYLRFCCLFPLPSLPLSQPNLCRFVAFLHTQNLSPSAIRVYLSGVRYYQIFSQVAQTPPALICRSYITSSEPSRWPLCLPIMPSVLRHCTLSGPHHQWPTRPAC